MRRVLCISYYHAPEENPGTRRIAAFARYLPTHGYQLSVLAANRRGTLPDDLVQRTLRATDLVSVPARLLHRSAAASHAPVVSAESRAARLLRTLLIPDLHASWLPLALARGRQVLASVPFVAIFSSSPPETNHLVAYQLARRSGLPWIADFRDGWMFEPLNTARLHNPLRRRIELALEGRVVRQASALVTINDEISADLRTRYPGVTVTTIPNGLDTALLASIVHDSAPARSFRLVYTGGLARARSGTGIEGLLAAFRLLAADHQPIMDDLVFQIAGDLSDAERAPLMQQAGTRVEILGRVAHQQALQLQHDASVLLLVTDPQARAVTTSKIFEYLFSGRPILALTRSQSVITLVHQHNAGVVVAPDDPAAIARALADLHRRWHNDDLPTQVHSGVQRYDRRALTAELTACFDNVLAQAEH